MLTVATSGGTSGPFSTSVGVFEPRQEESMEQRLQQELQNTSFKEWKSAGFEPEKSPK